MRTYVVPCRVVEVVDGDSLHCDLDLGWGVWLIDEPVRLARIDAPELSEPGGDEARDFLSAQLQGVIASLRASCTLTSVGFDKYRRALGELVVPGLGNVSDLMLQAGQAVPYP